MRIKEETPTQEPKRFTSKDLAEGFAIIEEGLAKFEAKDPDTARFARVYRGVMDCVACYKEIWEEKTRLDCFFKKVERPATYPSTSAASLPPPASSVISDTPGPGHTCPSISSIFSSFCI